MRRVLKQVFNISCFTIMFALCLSLLVSAKSAIDVYYSDDVTEEISKGVTHISGKRLTSRGLVNLEIVKVDLSNRNLQFKNVFNRDVMGKKTTVKNLIKNEKNVVAAVNGDFFEMNLSPSFELGVTINDGKLEKTTAGEYYNKYSDALATMLFDEDNEPTLQFLKAEVTFGNDEKTVYISYLNKAGNNEGSVILDGDYFTTSYSMDSRNPKCYKIVVDKDDEEITQIIEPGNTIDIHEGEYVVFIPENFDLIKYFNVGDEVERNEKLTINLDDVETCIGGAGQFLKNGYVVDNGYFITGYTGRTFIGYDSGKRNLYFGTVGGTTNGNAGISSAQLGELLDDYGITDAMHLDGGGSQTLMTKSSYDETVTQKNDVKSQRAIINAFVVTNNSKSSKLKGIYLDLGSNKAVKGAATPFKLCAYDENHKPISAPSSTLKIEGDKDIEVDYNRKTIIFKEDGRTNLKVTCGKYSCELYVDIYTGLKEIQILPDPIILDVKDSAELQIIAFTGENYKIPIATDSCEFTITPSNIAKVEDGKIVGKANGVGTIKVEYDGLSASSKIAIGKEEAYVERFSSSEFEAVSYPESVVSEIDTDDDELTIKYEFAKSNETQAAYAKYKNKLKLPKGATTLSCDLKGDNKKCMLKVKLVDDDGNEENLTLCSNINFTSTKEVEVELPTSYSGNLYIERFYVCTLSTTKAIDSKITIDNVKCIIPEDYSGVRTEKSITREITSNNKTITAAGDKDIIFINNGSNGSMLANYLDYKMSLKLDAIENKELFVSRNTDRVKGTIATTGLNKYLIDDTLVITMSTISGSPFSKDPYQYSQIYKILEDDVVDDDDVENVVITLNGDLNTSTLAKDKAMLDYILNKVYNEKRVNFYVVMYAGDSPSDTTDNGIRYIRLSSKISNAYPTNIFVMRRNDEGKLDYNLINYEQLIKN
ncbi:MAG: phosphodiester glycosidase family protein [Clostridia bacterium]|nr:phosphodiester glycosidase family protein [Clostridia bacterium]